MKGLMIEKDQRQRRLKCHGGWTTIGICPEAKRRSDLQKFERRGHTGH